MLLLVEQEQRWRIAAILLWPGDVGEPVPPSRWVPAEAAHEEVFGGED